MRRARMGGDPRARHLNRSATFVNLISPKQQNCKNLFTNRALDWGEVIQDISSVFAVFGRFGAATAAVRDVDEAARLERQAPEAPRFSRGEGRASRRRHLRQQYRGREGQPADPSASGRQD